MTAGEVHQLANRFNRIMRAEIDKKNRDELLDSLKDNLETVYDIDPKATDGNEQVDKYVMALHQNIVETRNN